MSTLRMALVAGVASSALTLMAAVAPAQARYKARALPVVGAAAALTVGATAARSYDGGYGGYPWYRRYSYRYPHYPSDVGYDRHGYTPYRVVQGLAYGYPYRPQHIPPWR